jgi:hypothetical protein
MCDKCGDPAPISTEGAKVAREYAKHENGYIYRDKLDICPRCRKDPLDESEDV